MAQARFQIRRATAEDVIALAQLRYDFRSELDPPTEGRSEFVERCADWMKRELSPAGVWQCWLATAEETPVGTLWLRVIEKLPNPVGHPTHHGYVSSVYVVPSLRNAGVGSALLQACVAHAQATGIDSLFLWPSERSRPLYARHGFAVSTDILERR
jgi:GNAT superfamily N-acetyltransferase